MASDNSGFPLGVVIDWPNAAAQAGKPSGMRSLLAFWMGGASSTPASGSTSEYQMFARHHKRR